MDALFLQSAQGLVDWWLGLPTWLWLLIIVAGSLVLGYAVERTIIAILRHWSKKTTMQLDDVIVDSVHPALFVFSIVGLIWVGVRSLPVDFRPSTVEVFDNIGLTLMVLAVAVAAVRLTGGMFRLGAKKEPRFTPLAATGTRLVSIAIYAVAIVLILANYNINITPVVASLGIGALAVGLALQDTLANFFAGLWIQGQRTLQPTHYVKVQDQDVEGFVEKVGWRTTRLRTLPGNLIDVPNSKMAQSTVQDFFLPEPKMGTSINITTGFEADPEKVVPMILEECLAAADEVSYVLMEPAASARLNKALENGWEYWVGFWVPYYYNQWNAQGYVLNRIRRRFLKEGIRIPYPIRETYQVPEQRGDRQGAITAPERNGATKNGSGRMPVGQVVVRPGEPPGIEPVR